MSPTTVVDSPKVRAGTASATMTVARIVQRVAPNDSAPSMSPTGTSRIPISNQPGEEGNAGNSQRHNGCCGTDEGSYEQPRERNQQDHQDDEREGLANVDQKIQDPVDDDAKCAATEGPSQEPAGFGGPPVERRRQDRR